MCRKAENWRGEEGERRKTAVYDYIWEEEEVSRPLIVYVVTKKKRPNVHNIFML